MAGARRFYVYELIDPRSGRVFYVGKGKGRRCYHHERIARKGGHGRKSELIREILAGGHTVGVKITRYFAREDAAYEYEKLLIARYGRKQLVNNTAGGRCPAWVTPDPRISEDKLIGRVFITFWRKTAGFTKPSHWYYCGKWHDIPAALYETVQRKWHEVIARRGASWALAQLAQNNH